jgi:P27 family predicted phage terminase small subunit
MVWNGLPESAVSPLDTPSVERLCRLWSERARWAELVKARPLLRRPIQNSRGAEIGHEWYVNPAEAALRRVDKALDALSNALALSPQSRARLGYTVAQAHQARAETETLLQRLARPAAERVEIEIIED